MTSTMAYLIPGREGDELFRVMIGSLMLVLGDEWMLITQVFTMCLGMFVTHTLAASEVNHNGLS